MAGGGGGVEKARELNQTPTWAVALVVAVIIIISILLEKTLHIVGKAFQRRKKIALVEALEKIKAELMVLGFISLILTFGQNYITRICIPYKLANTLLPCNLEESNKAKNTDHHRRLLWYEHRILAADSPAKACKDVRTHAQLINRDLLIIVFVLVDINETLFRRIYYISGIPAAYIGPRTTSTPHFHILFSHVSCLLQCLNNDTGEIEGFIYLTISRLQIRKWKNWEREIENEHETNNGASQFKLTHENSFVKGHTSSWMTTPVVCFFRHITYSVQRPDYLTLRHGFISVHLAPGTKFNFQQYIKRSLEDDFKVVVGIPYVLFPLYIACLNQINLFELILFIRFTLSPTLWMTTVVYLLLNVKGWNVMFWLSVMPVLIILAVGTKLQSIITRMAIEIQQRHAVVQGIPLVQLSDKHFWFSSPTLILYLIHLTLFQNAFEITHFIWISYEFGLRSCFARDDRITYLRVALGLGVQFLVSYITLPLYALVTQMGSHMKRSIFDEQTSKALKHWHEKVRKKPHTPRKSLLAIKGPEDHSPLAAEAAADHKSSPFGHAAAESSSIEIDNLNITKVDIPEDIPTPLDDQSGNKDLLTGL
ncbi:hypothetical protein ACJIZ3_003307 [Penstemon smallii]|uniref:MLO-like protein n=1 Tax=Penstemon smallii TaxID=265156 RepID=A0ABD3U8V2_9LAMI